MDEKLSELIKNRQFKTVVLCDMYASDGTSIISVTPFGTYGVRSATIGEGTGQTAE